MENLYPIFISIALPLIGGIISIYLGYNYLQKVERVGKNGIKTEGIIFDFVDEGKVTFGPASSTSDYPISDKGTPRIRFLTEKQEWITEKSRVSVSTMKMGDKVQVIYNPDNPREFIFASEKKFGWLAYIVILAGVSSTLFGLYKLVIYLMS